MDWPDEVTHPREHAVTSTTFALSGDVLLNIDRIFQDLDEFSTVVEVHHFKRQIEDRHALIGQREQELREALARMQQGRGVSLMDFRLSNGLFLYRERYPAAMGRIEERLAVLADSDF